jgi:hypothetical protein
MVMCSRLRVARLYHQKSRVPSGLVVLHQLEVDDGSFLLKELVAVVVEFVGRQRSHQLSPLRRSPDKADEVVQFAYDSALPPKSELTLVNLEGRFGEGFSLERIRVLPPKERSGRKVDDMPKAPRSMVSHILLGHRRRK